MEVVLLEHTQPSPLAALASAVPSASPARHDRSPSGCRPGALPRTQRRGFLNRTSDNPHFNLESRICNAALLRHARTAFRASGEAGHRSPGEMCTRALAYQMWLTVSPSSPQTVYVAADLLHPLLEELTDTGKRLGRRVRTLSRAGALGLAPLRHATRAAARRGLNSLDSAGSVAAPPGFARTLSFSRCVAAGEEPVRGTVAEHAAELTRQTDHVLVDWLASSTPASSRRRRPATRSRPSRGRRCSSERATRASPRSRRRWCLWASGTRPR